MSRELGDRTACGLLTLSLAREVTKWNKACDKRLHRLVSYLHHTKDRVMHCWVGDNPEDCILVLYVDASFAGWLKDSKSTTGAYLCLVGPKTFVPITWLSKKQGAVSHSSSEVEVIALDAATRMEGISALSLWDTVVEVFGEKCSNPRSGTEDKPGILHDVKSILTNVDYVPPTLPISSGKGQLVILEDNDAVIKMVSKNETRIADSQS